MEQTYQSTNYGGDAARNYEKFFVPTIGAPTAEDLLTIAGPKSGESVLDVACGTGIVARLAAPSVGTAGKITGLDQNPGMLAVARSATPADLSIQWIEADATEMPLQDSTYDVVLCQLGLQFIPNKLAALREMRRVLKPGGRVHVSVPGPKPRLFAAMSEGIARHIGQDGATFMDLVFSMHDADELRDLFQRSGFRDVQIDATPKLILAPPPQEFLWQYIHSTPLAQVAKDVDENVRDSLESEVVRNWKEFVVDGNIQFRVVMNTVSAVR